MQALKETTGGVFPAHTYLIDGTRLVAYIRVGTLVPYYFNNGGIKGFSKSGRKFVTVTPNPFEVPILASHLVSVQGSKGQVYTVDTSTGTCTCPGYTFRGACKHVKELELA